MQEDRRDFLKGVASGAVVAALGIPVKNAISATPGSGTSSHVQSSSSVSGYNNGDNKMAEKRILLTGAGSGFGMYTALELASRGHQVIATVEIPAHVTALRKMAQERKVELRVEKVDITKEQDRKFAASIDADILFNNAGLAEGGAVAEMPVDVMRHEFETNVFSALDLTQKFIRRLVDEKRQGKVIFMSSVVGFFSPAFTGAYSASKHAVEAIAESLYEELKPYGVKVTTINPGPYLTGFNDRMLEAAKVWYDPKINFIDHSKLAFPGEQFDPLSAIGDIVKVIENDNGKFRNILPSSFEGVVKQFQANAWERKV